MATFEAFFRAQEDCDKEILFPFIVLSCDGGSWWDVGEDEECNYISGFSVGGPATNQ